MAYILWMARGIWKGGFDMNARCETKPLGVLPSIFAGVMSCLISPYMMIMFPLVLPNMMDISTILMLDFLIIALATFGSLLVGAAIIVGFAAQLCRLVRSPKHAITVNRTLVLPARIRWWLDGLWLTSKSPTIVDDVAVDVT
jgi:threonine/homoserine/homoserine lactone efflux protein